jgi:hypothetical protein
MGFNSAFKRLTADEGWEMNYQVFVRGVSNKLMWGQFGGVHIVFEVIIER